MKFMFRSMKALFVMVSAVLLYPGSASAQHYTQTNLVSDIVGNAAVHDPNLINPWGITRSATSPWWVSDNNAGVSTLYTGTGQIIPINGNGTVITPAPKNRPQAPSRLQRVRCSMAAVTLCSRTGNQHCSYLLPRMELSLDGTVERRPCSWWITTTTVPRTGQSIKAQP